MKTWCLIFIFLLHNREFYSASSMNGVYILRSVFPSYISYWSSDFYYSLVWGPKPHGAFLVIFSYTCYITFLVCDI